MHFNKLLKKAKETKRLKYAWLIIILLIAIILNFYPHFDYPYLIHVDEWYHIAQAKQIVLQSDVNWYTGENFELEMERAWHGFLAAVDFIFRPSITQWIYLPTILHLFGVLSVYYFVSKLFSKKEALIASLLVALLPSNVTMGGPVFLIPLNLGLIFIPLALVFAFRLTKIKPVYNYFLLYAHPPTAMVLLLILGVFFLLNIFSKNDEYKKNAKYLFITIVLSIFSSIPNFIAEIQKKALQSITFDFWVYIQAVPLLFGLIPTIFFLVGFYYLTQKRRKEIWSLLLASIVLIINILIFSVSGLNIILPYQRTHIPLFIFMSIVASYGFTKLLDFKKPYKKIGIILLVVFLVATTSVAVHRNIDTSYYNIIGEEEYDDFLWIKSNTPRDAIIIADPWKARALAPVAERRVYTVLPFGPETEQMIKVNQAINFFANNCTNTTFLIKNKITHVYTVGYCQNQDLILIRENFYRVNVELD
jgi:hypothetical protein